MGCPPLGNLPNPGNKLASLMSPFHWQADSLPLGPPGKPFQQILYIQITVLEGEFYVSLSLLISSLGAYFLSPLGRLLDPRQLRKSGTEPSKCLLWSNSIFTQSYSLTRCSHHTVLQLCHPIQVC